MEAELSTPWGYEKHDPVGYGSGRRNGNSRKTLPGEWGEVEIEAPRDRAARGEPKSAPPGETRWAGFADKILSRYARALTRRDIQGQ